VLQCRKDEDKKLWKATHAYFISDHHETLDRCTSTISATNWNFKTLVMGFFYLHAWLHTLQSPPVQFCECDT